MAYAGGQLWTSPFYNGTSQENLQFEDGDTIVLISNRQYYKVHSLRLRQMSIKFAELLDGAFTSPGETQRYFFVLRAGAEKRVPYELHSVRVDGSGKPLYPTLELPFSQEEWFGQAWDYIFHYMYDQNCALPRLPGRSVGEDLNLFIGFTEQVILAAKYLGNLRFVAPAMDLYITQDMPQLAKKIIDNPIYFLNMGLDLRSKELFREALVHSVGSLCYEEVERAIVDLVIPDRLERLLRRKALQLVERVKLAQVFLASIEEDLPQHTGFPELSNVESKYVTCLAMRAFRGWLSERAMLDETHHAVDMGFSVITMLYKGAYLGEAEVVSFCEKLDIEERLRPWLRKSLDAIKTRASQSTKGLVLQHTVAPVDVPWFTCVQIGEMEYPW